MRRDIQTADYMYASLAAVIVACIGAAFSQARNAYFSFIWEAGIAFAIIFIPYLISFSVMNALKVFRRTSFYFGTSIINVSLSAMLVYGITQGFPNRQSALVLITAMGAASLMASAIYGTLCRWR